MADASTNAEPRRKWSDVNGRPWREVEGKPWREVLTPTKPAEQEGDADDAR